MSFENPIGKFKLKQSHTQAASLQLWGLEPLDALAVLSRSDLVQELGEFSVDRSMEANNRGGGVRALVRAARAAGDAVLASTFSMSRCKRSHCRRLGGDWWQTVVGNHALKR